MPIRQLTVGASPAVSLRGAEVEVVVIPAEGGRLANLRRPGGREWLRGGASGGWREFLHAAPTGSIAAEPADLWQDARWQQTLLEHADGITLASRVLLSDPALDIQRELTVDANVAVVRVLYALRHVGTQPLSFAWGVQSSWTARAGTSLHIPGMTQVLISSAQGRPDLDVGDLVSWPGAIGGDAARFRVGESQAWTLTCAGDLGAPGRIVLVDPARDERLEMRTDIARVPHVVVDLLGGGSDDVPPGICAAPHIGAPRGLLAAELAGTAATLAPGEERAWGIEIRLVDPDRDDLPEGP